jgi:hypothetical protein
MYRQEIVPKVILSFQIDNKVEVRVRRVVKPGFPIAPFVQVCRDGVTIHPGCGWYAC